MLVFSAAMLMGISLYWPRSRITKGLSLVGLAVTTTLMYGYVIEPQFAALAPRPGDWGVLQMYKRLFLGTRPVPRSR